ncbi:hypothetical protein GPALN_010985 [Globodera pallida]|nr:hypothetical protein GPALN_010985 [Globodera pallida]
MFGGSGGVNGVRERPGEEMAKAGQPHPAIFTPMAPTDGGNGWTTVASPRGMAGEEQRPRKRKGEGRAVQRGGRKRRQWHRFFWQNEYAGRDKAEATAMRGTDEPETLKCAAHTNGCVPCHRCPTHHCVWGGAIAWPRALTMAKDNEDEMMTLNTCNKPFQPSKFARRKGTEGVFRAMGSPSPALPLCCLFVFVNDESMEMIVHKKGHCCCCAEALSGSECTYKLSENGREGVGRQTKGKKSCSKREGTEEGGREVPILTARKWRESAIVGRGL